MPYEPQEGDVEGIDYMYVADSWINPEDIPDDAMEFENIKQYSGYRAHKLAGFVEAVFEYDEDMMSATISSFEKITGQAVPEDDSIKLPGVSDILADSVEGMMALLYGAYVDFESTGFEKNVILSTEKITTGESYDAALAAMEGVSENIAVFEFIATKDQQTVQPANPVRVTLAVPEDFSAQFGVFSVSPDGTLTKLDMNVDVDMGVVTTYLSQLGTVVIADANPCPPLVVGVGIGSDFEGSATLSKKALCRDVSLRNEYEFYKDIEERILCELNSLNIGAQGFGGDTTALAVNIEVAPTHIAGLPVAVNIGCHVTRHKEKVI
jgi:hypothetical protein